MSEDALPRALFGHPPGLRVLFATEMWERFSYFGNAALVVLYMVQYLFEPGRVEGVFGFAVVRAALEFLFGPLERQPLAAQLFGFYSGLAYLTPILGGLLADRFLGQRRTVIAGGLLMAAGHFMMAFEPLFLVALLFLILGIGAFKPNISTQVGSLYAEHDPRRDRAYSIFYIGINIGAFAAPLVCGTLAVAYGWHAGFGAAGIGMLVSLAIYLAGQRHLPPEAPRRALPAHDHPPLKQHDRRAISALLAVCAIVAFFWATYDQQSITVVLWVEDFTDRAVDLRFWAGNIPTAWFLALNPLMIFFLTPLLLRRWAAQSRQAREPHPVAKMALGFFCVASAYVVLAASASLLAPGDKASPLWMVAYVALLTIGELHLAPIGLSLFSQAAPARYLSLMMGVWFATTFPGDVLGGWLGGYWSIMAKESFFLMIASIAALAGAALWAAGPAMRSMLHREPIPNALPSKSVRSSNQGR